MPLTFADLGVPADLSRLLKNRGIVEPFPIQAATLPDALAGRDICGKAPTGSGKTLAFGLAIAARGATAAPRRPRALVLVPTRELAAQVAGEIEALQTRRGEHVVAIYGGAGYGPQRKALARGAATVVACPGRLEDLLAQGDVSLDDVDIVVLDEADRMADMGFMPAVKRILDRTNPVRQTLLFSATLDREVDALVRRYQRDPARHDVGPDADDVGEVAHHFWKAAPAQRTGLTAALVHRHGRAIVFCRTRRGADRLTRQLGAAGVDAAAIHGSRSQAQRERALSAFATGRVSALVATDVAARGIHVDEVACVVHYDLPEDPKDYVHRSGRTGRAGASGVVVSLVSDEHRKTARTLQRSLGLTEELTAADLTDDDIPPARTDATRTATVTEPAPARRRKPRRPTRGDAREHTADAPPGRRDRTASQNRRSRSGRPDARAAGDERTPRPTKGARRADGLAGQPAGSGDGNRSSSRRGSGGGPGSDSQARRKRRTSSDGPKGHHQRPGSPQRTRSRAGSTASPRRPR